MHIGILQKDYFIEAHICHVVISCLFLLLALPIGGRHSVCDGHDSQEGYESLESWNLYHILNLSPENITLSHNRSLSKDFNQSWSGTNRTNITYTVMYITDPSLSNHHYWVQEIIQKN